MQKYFYTIIGTSRNAYGGPRHSVAMHSEKGVIDLANEECNREGISLTDLADIEQEFDEDGNYVGQSREWDEGEELKTALEKLNDDGRLFAIYSRDSSSETDEFVAQADYHGAGQRARKLADMPE